MPGYSYSESLDEEETSDLAEGMWNVIMWPTVRWLEAADAAQADGLTGPLSGDFSGIVIIARGSQPVGSEKKTFSLVQAGCELVQEVLKFVQ